MHSSSLEVSETPPETQEEKTPSAHAPIQLPEKPVVVIEPTKSWTGLRLREVWNYRELLYFLTWRDIKVRYRQTALGAAWAVIQPIFTMLIFTLFFGRLAGIPSDGIPYPIFAFAGLLPWIFFSNAVVNSSNSLVNSVNLITKVYFPRMIIPVAATFAGLLDFGISFVIMVGLFIYYGIGFSLNLLMFPVLIVLTTLFASGVGMWLSALYVKYRDIRHALPFVMQIWLFASPIIYPASIVPEKWRWLLALNPMGGLIEGFRSSLFNKPFAWTQLAISTVIIFAVLIYAMFYFRKMEKSFADII